MDDAFDKYSRLSTDEIAAGSAIAKRARDDGEFVSPVPTDAPLPPTQHFNHGEPTATWIYRDANGAELCRILRFDFPDRPKEFCPLTLWRKANRLRWCWKALPAPRPLYGLDRLAARPDAPVIVCEGEKAADAAARIFPDHVIVTSSGGSRAAAKADWGQSAGRCVIIWPDNDEPGADYAREVAAILTGLGCEVAVIDAAALVAIDGGARRPDLQPIGWDAANAIAEWADTEALRCAALSLVKPCVTASHTPQDAEPTPDEAAIERRVAELSGLSAIKYALARASAAKELGIPVGVLDKLVKARRPTDGPGQGRAITFPVIEPWPSPVDGAAMLKELVAALRRYVVLTILQAVTVALWIVFTHVHDAFDVSPRLFVKSLLKRSGKTTLFTVLARLVARPRGASGITASALLRVIELYGPTMLVDEMDALMAGDREMSQALRGLMNSGFNRAFATFTMSVKTSDGGYEPREFSSWAPLALAGIGDLPDTVRDRAIEIEMKRKLISETVKRLRRRDGADLNEIARKLPRWSTDSIDKLRDTEPAMPDGLNDRAADAWEPLVSIADLVGGDWPALAREAALALSGDEVAAAKDENTDTMLLSDIRDAFDGAGAERLSGENLTAYLTGLEARPWAEWKHGKPLTKFQLARRLKKYRVVSGALDFGGDEGRLKGYRREDFEDAFERYLPSATVSTRELVIGPEKPEEIPDFELVTSNSDHELKNAENPSNSGRLHEFTSSSQAPASGSGFRSKGATAEGRENAHATPLTPDSEGKPVWTGRAVL
jgi:5S rRNA maturation endonuclease (ribonuclease M5)